MLARIGRVIRTPRLVSGLRGRSAGNVNRDQHAAAHAGITFHPHRISAMIRVIEVFQTSSHDVMGWPYGMALLRRCRAIHLYRLARESPPGEAALAWCDAG